MLRNRKRQTTATNQQQNRRKIDIFVDYVYDMVVGHTKFRQTVISADMCGTMNECTHLNASNWGLVLVLN